MRRLTLSQRRRLARARRNRNPAMGSMAMTVGIIVGIMGTIWATSFVLGAMAGKIAREEGRGRNGR